MGLGGESKAQKQEEAEQQQLLKAQKEELAAKQKQLDQRRIQALKSRFGGGLGIEGTPSATPQLLTLGQSSGIK